MMEIEQLAKTVIERGTRLGIKIATAESCTGGLIAAALTEIAGSSAVLERGFVTYSNQAKADMLGVPIEHTDDPGAVSELVAREMAVGAIKNSNATASVAVTGIAGPGGGSAHKPVGLVFIAAQRRGSEPIVRKCLFADQGKVTRGDIRQATVQVALHMLLDQMD